MIYLGIDLGTSNVKILATNEDGNILGVSCQDYPIYHPQPGWAEQNPEDWWDATLKALESLCQQEFINPLEIQSIGFSGQMHGLVMLDQQGQVLHPALLWCDQRTSNECEIISQHFSLDALKKTVSNQVATGFTAPKILWIKRNKPELFEKIAHILLPKDYIRFKLSGHFATDFSDASGMLLLDIKNKKWSKEMCNFLKIKENWLPELYESYEITGIVKLDLCKKFGLKEFVLLVAGAGDQAAGAVGTSTIIDGRVSVTLGTSGVVFASLNHFKADENLVLHSFCHANGKYHFMGVMLSAANSLKWWSENVHNGTDIDLLLQEAEIEYTNHSKIIFLPYLMGERTPHSNPYSTGTFIGLTPTSTRGQMTKAILEGVAFGLLDSLKLLESENVVIDEIRMIGGGAKSRLWQQILTDIFGKPVYRVNSTQGSALGAAILAMVGAGIFNTVEEASEHIVKKCSPTYPNQEHKSHYHNQYKRFQKLYASLENWYYDNN